MSKSKTVAKIIRVNGETETLKDKSLKGLQSAVDGLIEFVYLDNGKLLIIDEEGKLKNKEINAKATALYKYDVIVGDVIYCDAYEID